MGKIDKNLVFYGGGKMAESIIRGLIENGKVDRDHIAVQELLSQRSEKLAQTYGIAAGTNMNDKIRNADMILIGVNPFQIEGVTQALLPVLNPNTIVLSYACGVKISVFADQLGKDKKIARIVPNTLSLYGNGYSAAAVNENLTEEDRAFVQSLLEGLGKVLWLEEEKFNDFQAYSCTGPLWIYKFAEAMIDAGIYIGFTREEARSLLVENLLGTARGLADSGVSPTAIIEDLTSPGGVTIEALRVLQENGSYLTPTIASMEAAVKKCAAVAEK